MLHLKISSIQFTERIFRHRNNFNKGVGSEAKLGVEDPIVMRGKGKMGAPGRHGDSLSGIDIEAPEIEGLRAGQDEEAKEEGAPVGISKEKGRRWAKVEGMGFIL